MIRLQFIETTVIVCKRGLGRQHYDYASIVDDIPCLFVYPGTQGKPVCEPAEHAWARYYKDSPLQLTSIYELKICNQNINS